MLKIGLLGKGGISTSHLKAYNQLNEETNGVVIAACCDIREEVLTDLPDSRLYTDVDEFLEKEQGQLDYIDICLPTYMHKDVSVKAMRMGYNVLCEKPMALNYKECQEMCRVAKETGKKFMIAHCSRFMGASMLIKEYIENCELGKPYSAEFHRQGGSLDEMGYNNWFRDVKLSGGAMLDLHVHDVDMIYGMFGMPKAVSAAAKNRIDGAGWDAMSINYMYDDMFVSAICDWTIYQNKFDSRTIRVNFEKGYIFVDRTADRNAFLKVDIDGNVEDLWEKVDANVYYTEIKYYIDCLTNNKPVDYCLPEDSAKAIRIVQAEMKSADLKGEKVEL